MADSSPAVDATTTTDASMPACDLSKPFDARRHHRAEHGRTSTSSRPSLPTSSRSTSGRTTTSPAASSSSTRRARPRPPPWAAAAARSRRAPGTTGACRDPGRAHGRRVLGPQREQLRALRRDARPRLWRRSVRSRSSPGDELERQRGRAALVRRRQDALLRLDPRGNRDLYRSAGRLDVRRARGHHGAQLVRARRGPGRQRRRARPSTSSRSEPRRPTATSTSRPGHEGGDVREHPTARRREQPRSGRARRMSRRTAARSTSPATGPGPADIFVARRPK